MPVESAFKLHLITLNRDRLIRVIASFEQKLASLKAGLTGPQMGYAEGLECRSQKTCVASLCLSPLCSVENLLVQASLSY